MKRLITLLFAVLFFPIICQGQMLVGMTGAGEPPTTPVISATGGNTTVTITLVSGDVGALTNILYWDTTPGKTHANSISNATLVAAGFPGTPYVHTGRTNGTPYYYSLVGTDLAGSTESNEATATPAAGGCTTSNDTLIIDKSGTSETGAPDAYDAARFVLTATTTITQYIPRIDDAGADFGSVTFSIYTDDSDKPGTIISGTLVSVNMADVPDTYGDILFTLSTPKSLAAGTYWLVSNEVGSAKGWAYRSSGGDVMYYGANDPPASRLDNYTFEFKIMGCQ